MNKIHEVVTELHQTPGVKGAAVVTMDGLIAASALDASIVADVIAGMTSHLMMTANKSLGEGGLGGCGRLTLTATHGKVVFVDLTESCLVVLFDQFTDPASVSKDIDAAAARIRRSARLS